MADTHAVKARAYLMLGIGYSLLSDEVQLQNERVTYQSRAIDALHKWVHENHCFLQLV